MVEQSDMELCAATIEDHFVWEPSITEQQGMAGFCDLLQIIQNHFAGQQGSSSSISSFPPWRGLARRSTWSIFACSSYVHIYAAAERLLSMGAPQVQSLYFGHPESERM